MTQFVIQGLKTEIIEAAKSRIDLLKWKFLLIAGLGSIDLGLQEEVKIFAPQFTLCLIPFVCCYVDLLCKHLNLRILVINKFMTISSKLNIREDEPLKLYQHYEKFCYLLRNNRTIAKRNYIISLTWIFGLVLFITGLISLLVFATNKNYCSLESWKKNIGMCLIIFAFFMCLISSYMRFKQQDSFKNRTFALEDLAQEWLTILCSFSIAIIGLILLFHDANNDIHSSALLCFSLLENTKTYVIISGLIGLLITFII
ncbi:MAG: hypothetical protein AB4372_38810 [Xenococcus sp. (in: cyanobacteria)]